MTPLRADATVFPVLLCVDVGNSTITVGVFPGGEPLLGSLSTQPLRDPGEYASWLNNFLEKQGLKGPFEALLCSVVPSHTPVLAQALRAVLGLEPLLVGPGLARGMGFAVREPGALGADRVAAAYGAWRLYGAPVAVALLGTAAVVDFVASGGVFLGGAIFPGPALMGRALAEGTAQLPLVEPSRALRPPGRDTEEALVSGIIYAVAGALERILREVEAQEGPFQVVLAGGYAALIGPLLQREVVLEPALVLKGMACMHEAQRDA